jgi:hypothetical protein
MPSKGSEWMIHTDSSHDRGGMITRADALDELDPELAASDYRLIQRISMAVSALAALGIAVHLIWPDLKIDLVTVALLVLGCLPWLRGIVRSISLPGGASIEMRNYHRARAIAREEERQTNEAVRAVGSAADARSASERIQEIGQLAERYETVRRDMSSGRERTRAMGEIARQILSLLPASGLDVSAGLLNPGAGRRLVAYLSLMARPDAAHGEELIETLTEREGIPYNQSWALRALGLILDRSGPDWVSPRSVALLAGMRDGLRPGSDRQVMLAEVVDRLRQPEGLA